MAISNAGCGCHTIFRTKITLRSGQVLYASQFGLKGFPIKVRCPLHKRDR